MEQGSLSSNQCAYTAVPIVMQSSFVQRPVYHSYVPGAQQIQNVYNPHQTPRSDIYQQHAHLQSASPQTAGPHGVMFLPNMPPPFPPLPQQGQAIQYSAALPAQYMTGAQQPNPVFLPRNIPPPLPQPPHNLSLPPSSVPAPWTAAVSPSSPYRMPGTSKSSPVLTSFTPTLIPSRLKLLAEHYVEKSNSSSDSFLKGCFQHGIKIGFSVTTTITESSKAVISPSSGPNFVKLSSADEGMDIQNSKDGNNKTDIQNLVDYYVNKHVGLSHPKVTDNTQMEQTDSSQIYSWPKETLSNNYADKSENNNLKTVLQLPSKLENDNVNENPVVEKINDVMNWLSKSESELVKGYPNNLSQELNNESILNEVTGDGTLVKEVQERYYCPMSDLRKNPDELLRSDIADVSELVAADDTPTVKNNFFEGASDIVIEEHELLFQSLTDDLSEYSQDNAVIEGICGANNRSDFGLGLKENELHVKKGKDESDDFEKFFFKVTASRHGISISSPEKESESYGVRNRSQSLKTLNDVSSIEGSQSDVGDAFKLKAFQSGIIVQDPREKAEISTDSDAELDQAYWQQQAYKDRTNLARRRHTSTPDPLNATLDPKIPEFKPKSRKRAISCGIGVQAISEVDHSKKLDSSIRANAPVFVPVCKKSEAKKNVDMNLFEQKEQEYPKELGPNINIAVQACPDTSDVNVETDKTETKESSMATSTCDSRDVSVNTVTDSDIIHGSDIVKRSSKRFSTKATNTDVLKKRTIGTHFKERVKPKMKNVDTMTECVLELDNDCRKSSLDVTDSDQIMLKKAFLMESFRENKNDVRESEVAEGNFRMKDHLLKFVLDIIGLFTGCVEPQLLKEMIERKVQVLVDDSLIHAQSVSKGSVSSSGIGECLMPDISNQQTETKMAANEGSSSGTQDTACLLRTNADIQDTVSLSRTRCSTQDTCSVSETSLAIKDVNSVFRNSKDKQDSGSISRTSIYSQDTDSVSKIRTDTQVTGSVSGTSHDIQDTGSVSGTSHDIQVTGSVSGTSHDIQVTGSVSGTSHDIQVTDSVSTTCPDTGSVSETSLGMENVSSVLRTSPDIIQDIGSLSRTSSDYKDISSVSRTRQDTVDFMSRTITSFENPPSEKKNPKESGFMEIEDDTDEDDDGASTTVIMVDELNNVEVNEVNKEIPDIEQTLQSKKSRDFREVKDSTGSIDEKINRVKTGEGSAGIFIKEVKRDTLKQTSDVEKPVYEINMDIPALSKLFGDELKVSEEIQMNKLCDIETKKLDTFHEKTLFDKKVEEILQNTYMKEDCDNQVKSVEKVDYNNVKIETVKGELSDKDIKPDPIKESNSIINENSTMFEMISEKMSKEYVTKPDNKGDASHSLDNANEGGNMSDTKETSTVAAPLSQKFSTTEINVNETVISTPPGLGGSDACKQSKKFEEKAISDSDVGMQNNQVVSFNTPVAGLPFMHPYIDPGIYQAVEAQLKMFYPDIASNPAVLTQLAIQQTCILQMCLNSQSVDVNQTHEDANHKQIDIKQYSVPDDQPLRLPRRPAFNRQGAGLTILPAAKQEMQPIPSLDRQMEQPVSQSNRQMPLLEKPGRQHIHPAVIQRRKSDTIEQQPISTLNQQRRQPVSSLPRTDGQPVMLNMSGRQPLSLPDKLEGQPVSNLDVQTRQIPLLDIQTFPHFRMGRKTSIHAISRPGDSALSSSVKEEKQTLSKNIQEQNFSTSNESWDDEIDDNPPGLTLHDVPDPSAMVTRESIQSTSPLSAPTREVAPVISGSSVTDLCEISLSDRLKTTVRKVVSFDILHKNEGQDNPEQNWVGKSSCYRHAELSMPSFGRQLRQPIPQSKTQGKQPNSLLKAQGRQQISSAASQGKQPKSKSCKQGKQLSKGDCQGKQPISQSNNQGRQAYPSSDKRMREVIPSSHQQPQKYPCVSNESWDAEVDDYAPEFTLYHDVHRPITMVTKETKQAQFNKVINAPAKGVSSEISRSPMNDLCEIPLGNASTTTTVTDKAGSSDEWQEVQTVRKRHYSKKQQKDQRKISAPVNNQSSSGLEKKKQQRHSNFERLVGRMQEVFQHASRQEVIGAIEKIRQEQGTLSGMSMELILEKAQGYIGQEKKKTPGLMYEKKVHTLPPRMQQQRQQQQPPMKQQATAKPLSLLELKLPPRKSASIGFFKMDIPPRMKYSGASDTCLNTYDEDMCVICHDPLSAEVVKELDCRHVFHAECIGQWVEKERTCPTCRQHALFPEEFPRLGK